MTALVRAVFNGLAALLTRNSSDHTARNQTNTLRSGHRLNGYGVIADWQRHRISAELADFAPSSQYGTVGSVCICGGCPPM